MSDIPLIISIAGPVPTPPATLRSALLNSVAATNPGYTANLPGSLIEDIASTDVGAMVICDLARIETVNSLTPYGANAFLLSQLGQQFGVQIGLPTNTSVYIVFTANSNIGWPIPVGFTVSDGTYNYVVQDNGVIQASGSSQPLFAVASIQGSWSVPAGVVNQIVTSLPNTVTMTVTNPSAGTPGDADGETQESYRTRVLQAQLSTSQGMTRYLKTQLGIVPGVQQRLISARQSGGGWEVICGGGDQYAVANAIFQSLFDINSLVGSTISITNITKATQAVVTTNLMHGLIVGQTNVNISGVVGMTAINGGPYTVANVIDPYNVVLNVNSSGFASYVSGGLLTPNTRNVSVSINDYPDTYIIPFVNPPQQTVTMDILWNTNSTNFVNPIVVATLAAPALVNYINGVAVGNPMNVFEMNTVFQDAISEILDPNLLTRLVFTVSVNGSVVNPVSGTGIINGDPESFFFAVTSGIVINQG